MKHLVSVATTLLVLLSVTAAHAQLRGFGDALKKAAEKTDELTISESEERTIGEDVSTKIRARFGVVQDPAIHRYVTLVGTALAQQSGRPELPWVFIVLDTDGVNAFASPGGFVHITRGALGLIQNEAELGNVLGHEIAHVVRKHTVNAIQKNKVVAAGISSASGGRSAVIERMANQAYAMVLENSFDRGDELDADRVGIQLAQKLGYAAVLGEFLARLSERNKNQSERNGLFASHPETTERIDKGRQLGAAIKTTALAAPRYKREVKYDVPSLTAIAVVEEGAAGLAGGAKPGTKGADEGQNAPDAKGAKPEPRRRGFGLDALKQGAAQEKSSTQVSASGGARGLGADRAAKGGANPAVVRVSVTAAEIEAFRKGIS